MNQLKNELIQLIQESTNYNNLLQLYNNIKQHELIPYITDALYSRDIYSQSMEQWLLNLILFESDQPFEDKLKFLKKLNSNSNLIPIETLLDDGTFSLNDCFKNDQVFNDIKYHILSTTFIPNYTNTQLGKGEIFLTLFGEDVNKSLFGDISINGCEVEVKGHNARVRGMKGYSSPINANPIDYFKMKLNGIKLDPKKMTLIQWNNLNSELDKCKMSHNEIYDAFYELFSMFYVDKSYYQIADKWMESIVTGGRFHEDSKHYMTALQIDYYKSVEHFDKIIFVNVDTFNAVTISDGESYIKYKDLFKINGFSWVGKETRSAVNQITFMG